MNDTARVIADYLNRTSFMSDCQDRGLTIGEAQKAYFDHMLRGYHQQAISDARARSAFARGFFGQADPGPALAPPLTRIPLWRRLRAWITKP